jgi:hypothetical protein
MATKNKNSKDKTSTTRLTELVAYRRSQGSGVFGSLSGGIKERLKEKFDPRQLINQKGLLTALFPSLKTYQSKTTASEISKTSMQTSSFGEIKPILETISFNTKMLAKNTMVLPALHRDVNVIRQNMVKLVKMKGGDARTKADMYFVKAKDREDKYERELAKERNKQSRISKQEDEEEKKGGFLKKILSAITSGLKLIVNSIVALGKAIIGTFKLLGELIFSIMSGAINFLMSTLLGIAGLLKDGLGLAFEYFISKSIRSFFTKGAFLTTLITRVITSMIFWLGSREGIGFLIGRLAIPLAAMYGVTKIFSDVYAVTDPEKMYSSDELKRMQDESKQVFPTSDIKKGTGTPKVGEGPQAEAGRVAQPLKDEVIFGTNKEAYLQKLKFKQTTLDESTQKSVMGKRSPYELIIPGLNDSELVLLTYEEAKSWGDKTKKFIKSLKEYSDIKEGRVAYGGAGAEERKQRDMQFLFDEINEIRSSLYNDAENIVGNTFKSGPAEEVLRKIAMARSSLRPSFYEASVSRVMEATGLKSYLDEFTKEKENQLNSLQDKGINFLTENYGEFRNFTKQGISSANEGFTSMLNSLSQNVKNNKEQIVSEPIIITNNTQQSTSKPPDQSKPASAWNNDFFVKYYYDVSNSPFNIK